MGLIELTRELWAPVALAAVVLGGVALAFTQCAVAELVLRAAAWLYVKNGFVRRDKFVEWRAELRAMKASERQIEKDPAVHLVMTHALLGHPTARPPLGHRGAVFGDLS